MHGIKLNYSQISPARSALSLGTAALLICGTALAQNGSLQFTPNPPHVPPPPPLPSAAIVSAVPADYLPKRTPQFEIWRSGDTQPSCPPAYHSGAAPSAVSIASADVFAVRLGLQGLPVGTTVLTRGAGSLKLVDSIPGQSASGTTDAQGFAVFLVRFVQGERDGALVVTVDGVQTVLRLHRNSP